VVDFLAIFIDRRQDETPLQKTSIPHHLHP